MATLEPVSLAGGLCAISIVLCPSVGWPCGNGVRLAPPQSRPAQVARAERLPANGEDRLALAVLPHSTRDADEELVARGELVAVVAYLRLGQFIPQGVALLARHLEDDPEDPYLRARLAEGLWLMGDPAGALLVLGDLE